MPTYTIFAGVNGAGKTSIYKSIYYQENKKLEQEVHELEEKNIFLQRELENKDEEY